VSSSDVSVQKHIVDFNLELGKVEVLRGDDGRDGSGRIEEGELL
jgi:hypothetical protein